MKRNYEKRILNCKRVLIGDPYDIPICRLQQISINTMVKLYYSLVSPVLTYDSKTWKAKERNKKNLDTL